MKTELVAVPTATGARAAYLITLGADVNGVNGSPVAFATYVDARDGSILLREDLVDHDTDNPEWAVFPNTRRSTTPPPTPECAGAPPPPPDATRSSARRRRR